VSKNSKLKRDKKKKSQKKNNVNSKAFDPIKASIDINKLFDPKKLTTPKTINNDISTFCKKISDYDPVFIDVTPESWSRQSCCDLNVKKYIEENGGSIVCGYKIWYHDPIYIEAERHAVWFFNDKYKDVSFNADGEDTILFIPDTLENQSELDVNKAKIRWGKDSKTLKLIDFQQQNESFMSVERMSDKVAWDTMLTFEQWDNGQRMASIL